VEVSLLHAFQAIAKSALDLDALGRHVRCFKIRQPVDLFHALKTLKGLPHLVPPRRERERERKRREKEVRESQVCGCIERERERRIRERERDRETESRIKMYTH